MKNKYMFVISFVVVIATTFLCFYGFQKDQVSRASDVNEQVIDKILKDMTLDEKIAQMLIIGFDFTSIDKNYSNYFENMQPGGIIVMGYNISTFQETKDMIQEFKNFSNIPLIVSTDQEGGSVQRLSSLTDINSTNIPFMYDIGSTKDNSIAYDIGRVIAEEVRTLGINVVFAPVLDVFSNPLNKVIGKRSFGSDPILVSEMAISLADGLFDNGIIPTYKHFPGHGDTSVNSHTSLPIINKSYEEIKSLELMPYYAAIKNQAKIIMLGHISFPSITNDNTPASLSKIIINDILKRDMGYDGLIITDALNMNALTNNYSEEEIYIKAVEAGVDLLLMPKDPVLAIEVIKSNFDEQRIDESVRKILDLKYNYLEKLDVLDASFLGSEEHRKIIDRINN